MENLSKFEVIRHGHKQGEQLSEKGREEALEKAKEIYGNIESLPQSAVVCLFSSNIGRSIDTKNTIEGELRNIMSGDENTEFIAINDVEKIKELANDLSKRIVITETAPQTSLSWKTTEEHPADEAFDKYKKRYGTEDAAGKVWIARENELPALKEEFRAKYPEVDSEDIKPSEYKMTPEEFVISFLKFFERVNESAKKNFPERPVYIVAVSHNFNADFLTLALLDMPLSVASINELGGDFRGFVESSKFTIKDNEISSEYRGKEVESHKTIDDIRKDLQSGMEERKAEWSLN